MVNRLIIILILLAVAFPGVMAKSITLNELDFSNMPALETVINTVNAEGDSIVKEKKIYIVTTRKYKDGLYLHIELLKSESLPEVINYLGFYRTKDNELFFIRGCLDMDLINITSHRKRFELGFTPSSFDGVITWKYFIKDNKIYKINFKSKW